jgi:hypothetical protein
MKYTEAGGSSTFGRLRDPAVGTSFGSRSELSPPAHSHWYVLVFILTSALLTSLWGLRTGHLWGDDFAAYILQAKNFADGQPHRATGYLYNPNVPLVGPAEYPPAVPLILAGVYRFFGVDLRAMKIALTLVFLPSLIPLYLLTYEYLRNQFWTAVAVLSFALNPAIVGMHDAIGSDLPLLTFAFTYLDIVNRVYNKGQEGMSAVLGRAVLCGLLAYAAYATRSIGAVLIFVPLALDLLRRHISRFSVFLICTVCACVILQFLLLKPATNEASILRLLFVFNPVSALRVCLSYFRNTRMLIPIVWKPASFLLYAFAAALAALGAKHWAQRRAAATVWLFSAAYLLVIALYPASTVRYIVPLIPAMILLVAGGAIWLTTRIPGSKPVLLAAFAVYALACINADIHVDRSPILEGIGDPRFQTVCAWIAANTPKDAVVIFRKPRLLALLTGRTASVSSNDNAEAYLRSVNAKYVLIADNIPDEDLATQAPLRFLVHAGDSRFRPVLSIGFYHLYALF